VVDEVELLLPVSVVASSERIGLTSAPTRSTKSSGASTNVTRNTKCLLRAKRHKKYDLPKTHRHEKYEAGMDRGR